MYRLHGVRAKYAGGSDFSLRSDLPAKWNSFIAENRDNISKATNITAKKEALGKDKPECKAGARKP